MRRTTRSPLARLLAAMALAVAAWMAPTLAAPIYPAGTAEAAARPTGSPVPAQDVPMSAYTGRWHEIARMPNRLQRDCVAGVVDYSVSNGRIVGAQRCITRTQRTKEYRARGAILDPGANARLKLTFLGFWSQEYWILAMGRQAEWALIGEPSGRFLWLMSRTPALSAPARAEALAAAQRLGYPTDYLVFAEAT